jgi:carboxymethylenebutenolidase
MDAPPDGLPLKVVPVVGLAGNLSCPLLGLFGAEDTRPSPTETARLEQELARLGKTFEFHTYPGAGHGFFATDRPSYRPEAAADGWRRIWVWFGRHLAT